MLDPEHRRLYSECFAAPDGFVFDSAVGTTYSLDLESLLFALFCIATSGAAEPEAALSDPVGVLEAIHRTAERVTLFHHAGETNVPAQPQALFSLLEQTMVPALGRAGGAIFHPKLWVLRFKGRDDGRSWLRVVVLSRNLTTSRAWDSFLCLEGAPERGRRAESVELALLLEALPSLALSNLDVRRAAELTSLAEEVRRTAFAAPVPFDGVAEFRAMGFGEQPGFAPNEPGERVLAVSPFVSGGTLRALRELASVQATLIGRLEELGRCAPEVLNDWESFTLDDGACSDADAADVYESVGTADAAPQGLHAKILAIQNKRKTVWWFGSGNLTDPVRAGSSVEVMVRLVGNSSKVGIDQFLEAGFGSLLVPYQHVSLPPELQDGNRSAVEAVKVAMVRSELRLRCEQAESGWSLILAGIPELDEDVQVTCRPITLPGARTLELRPGRLEFREMTVEALTALICFQLSSGQGEARYACELTLKLPIEGMPLERDERISQAIIKDRAAFLRYLHCVLGNLGQELSGKPPTVAGGGTHAAGGALFASGLLEQLLKALHQEPERLRGLRSLLARTSRKTSAEEDVVPAEFRELWSVVEPYLPGEMRA